MSFYRITDEGVVLQLKVKAGAKQTRIVGVHDDQLKVQISTQPEHGKANQALIKWVATYFDVPMRNVSLLRGASSSQKQMLMRGADVSFLNKLVG